ncbi:MAG TPA: hypothetical protein VHP83_19710 [Aggregatilineaceae bacterium]|nr:hypothetical protein [Aggregatilineaceae bacterium]
MHHNSFRLLILLLMLPLLIIIGAMVFAVSRNDSAPVGVILAGSAADYGWENVADVPYSETTLQSKKLIFFSNFNSTDITLEMVVQTMITRGVKVICISPDHRATSNGTAIETQFPGVTFLLNLGTYRDINHLMPRLGTLREADGSGGGMSSGTLTFIGLACLLGVVVFLVAIMAASRSAVHTATPSKSLVTRLIDRISDGDNPKKKHSEKSSLHLRRLAIQDVAEKRMTVPEDEDLVMLHKLTTYVQGDNRYDESFGIEAPNLGEFHGECGINIAEHVNRYDPGKVSALEVWLFDKNDIHTMTGVLLSPYSFQNEVERSKLKSKGEAVQVEEDAILTLETQKLKLRVRVLSTQPGYDPALPANSFFEHVVLELIVWRKM